MSVPELTAVEERIVLLVARGSSTREIGTELGVSARTVEWHLARARRKLERIVTLHDRVRYANGSPDGPTASGGPGRPTQGGTK